MIGRVGVGGGRVGSGVSLGTGFSVEVAVGFGVQVGAGCSVVGTGVLEGCCSTGSFVCVAVRVAWMG